MERPRILFDLPTPALAILVLGLTFGSTLLGAYLGGKARHLSEGLGESFGVLQGALLGVVGLILAFGLSLALSRYEERRATLVTEANAIGTTYLRAQLLDEPVRARSLDLLERYAGSAVNVNDHQPGSAEETAAADEELAVQQRLWNLAGIAVSDAPVETAPRLYVETLNEMIDAQASRIASLNNRVPSAVLWLEIAGACVALALLAGYLAMVGRGAPAVLLASALVAFLLFVTADLDRPTRGIITVPDSVLQDQLDEMSGPPAAGPKS